MQSLLIHNARIWTGTGRQAHAMLLQSGRIAALDAEALASQSAATIDAGGRTVAPGLIDAHVHLLMAGQYLSQLDMSGVRSRDEFEAAVANRHEQLPAGQWLMAHGWSSENWGGEQPEKSWLASAGQRPVVAYRMDIHVALVNDAVLELCDVSRDPPGGRIQRNADGTPTGLMYEAAAWKLVNPLVPQPDVQAKRGDVLAAQSHAHSFGITTVGTMEYARDLVGVYQPMRNQLTLRCRATVLDRGWPMSFADPLGGEESTSLAVIGFKAFIDGTLGSRTARLLAEYSDDPNNRGMLVELAADGQLRDWALACAAAGFSPSMHAIGDEAVRLALDAIEGVEPVCRPRIEHAQQIDEADLPRFAGVIASMQPLHRADDGRYAEARLGTSRLRGFFPFRTLLEAGAKLAFGSDWPVVTCDPIAGIRAAVTGLTVDGRPLQVHETLSVEQALQAYTTGAAYALQLDEAGQLVPGNLADVVIFDRDPFTADWLNAPPRIATTIVGGEVVYDSVPLQ